MQFEKLVDLVLTYADINELNEDGKNPLMDAVSEGTPEIAKLLLARGADVNCQGIPHETLPHGEKAPEVSALYEVVSKGHEDMV